MLKNTVKKYCAEGSQINQVLMAILIVLPVFSYGAAVGWMSPMAPRLMSEDTPARAPVQPAVISWMASVVYLVATPAVFLFGYIVDNYGRKKALMLTSLAMTACWSLKLYSTETWALITARAIIGLGTSGSYVVTPLYMKEISEDSIVGTLGTLVVLSQNLGNLVVYLLGEYLSYHATLWICLAVPVLHLILFTSMPETPAYLLKCGKVEEARAALAWLRCRDSSEAAVDSELQLLLIELEKTKSGKFLDACKTILADRSIFGAFRIILIITMARELCGCLAVLHFASLIFEKTSVEGWVLSANQQAVVLGVVQMIGSCTASSLVERTGRKPLLGATCLLSGVSMCLLAAWFYALSLGFSLGGYWVSPLLGATCLLSGVSMCLLAAWFYALSLGFSLGGYSVPPLLGATCLLSGVSMCLLAAWFYALSLGFSLGGSWVPVTALCLCIYCDAAGLQPVPFVIMTEMFSFRLRGTVTSIVIAFVSALVSIELRVFHPLEAVGGLHTVFWLFSAVCIVSTVYIVLVVPETRMRSLDDIYAEIGGKKEDCEGGVTKL